MEFKEATDKLGLPLPEVAEELARDTGASVSVQWLRQARLDPQSSGYRTPPTAWGRTVARLARERTPILTDLADELEADAG